MSTNEVPCESDFNLIKFICKGSFGSVYLVQHKIFGERFAMKKIKKQNSPNQLQQVAKECEIMQYTDHPFIVSFICAFETKRHLCMVMEYVQGGDVATLIMRTGPLPHELARHYIAETILAVEHLHSHGIIHRDIKPENLLISSIGHIKLTDFGLSKIGQACNDDDIVQNCYEFNDQDMCGTPQYIAPEVILSLDYGKTIDWWSVGIILYEFLTSFHAFSGETPEDIYDNVLLGQVDWPDESDVIKVPEEAKNLIKSLMVHVPQYRLGARGAYEIKENIYFKDLDWDNLMENQLEFIPRLEGPDDTSYFDTQISTSSDVDLSMIHETDRKNDVGPIETILGARSKKRLSIVRDAETQLGAQSKRRLSIIYETDRENEVEPVETQLGTSLKRSFSITHESRENQIEPVETRSETISNSNLSIIHDPGPENEVEPVEKQLDASLDGGIFNMTGRENEVESVGGIFNMTGRENEVESVENPNIRNELESSIDVGIFNMTDTGIDSIVSTESLREHYKSLSLTSSKIRRSLNSTSSDINSAFSGINENVDIISASNDISSKNELSFSGKVSYCFGRVRAFFRSGFNRITRPCRGPCR